MVKTIHFILPGGGVRGSFQAGFLYELFTKHKEAFEIYKIDGTSVGSINGIASLLGEFDVKAQMPCPFKHKRQENSLMYKFSPIF